MNSAAIKVTSKGGMELYVYPESSNDQFLLIKNATGNSTFSRVKFRVGKVETDMWVNEDFDELELPLNEIATVCHGLMVGAEHGYICGDVLFTGPTDPQGFTRGLTVDEAAILVTFLADVEVRLHERV